MMSREDAKTVKEIKAFFSIEDRAQMSIQRIELMSREEAKSAKNS
jgi:hypothetical protein